MRRVPGIHFSPVSASGRWYNDPERAANAEIPHQVLGGTVTGNPWNVEDYDTLLCTLNTHLFLRTAIAGTNNDIDWIAAQPGAVTVNVVYAVAGNSTPLTIGVAGNVVTVNVATNAGGAATSTANDIVAAVRNSGSALSLVRAVLSPGNDGTGVVAALASTPLAAWSGGTPTLDVKLQTTVDGTNYYDVGAPFTQKNAASAAEGRVFTGLALQARWVLTVGGSTPLVACSISALDKREV